MRLHAEISHCGAQFHFEYQMVVLRHCSCGFSTTIVSIIENGAGSVDVSARPLLPITVATSGKPLMIRFCTCINRSASVTEMPGSVDGMYNNVPSSSGGMNSDPIFSYTGIVNTTTAIAAVITRYFHCSDQRQMGSYTRMRIRLIG